MPGAYLARLRAKATPQPFGMYTQPLRLGRPRSRPYGRVRIVCSENFLTLGKPRELLASGEPRARVFATPDWRFHELPTDHWPMFSTPEALTELLHGLRSTDPSVLAR